MYNRLLIIPFLCQQGSDLIDLQLTCKDMENFIFAWFLRIFGDILEDFRRIFEDFIRGAQVEQKSEAKTLGGPRGSQGGPRGSQEVPNDSLDIPL